MEEYLNKFYNFIDKIGKHNFILIIFIFIALITTSLYQTFSLYTESGGLSLVDGIETYSFILNNSNTTNSVTIAPHGSKYIDVTVSNESESTLMYVVYYSTLTELSEFNIGYRNNTSKLPNGTIPSNTNYTVTIRIDNYSGNDITINFGVSYGFENSETIILEENQNKIEEYKIYTMVEYIKNLYNDGSSINTVNIGGDTSKPTVSLNANQGLMLDNNDEYRYYGANPNNYVSYNDELWRIIGVSKIESTPGHTEYERVKIIRADSIGNYPYEYGEQAVEFPMWEQSTVQKILNSLYLNKQSGICYENTESICDFTDIGLSEEAKKMTSDTMYYNFVGNTVDETTYVDDCYLSERGYSFENSGYDFDAWFGRVGLMYPSDYLYATDLSKCIVSDYSTDSSCTGNNWLYDENNIQMTIFDDFGIFAIDMDGSIYFDYESNKNASVKPTVYLTNDVVFAGGNGTSTNPYRLQLNDEKYERKLLNEMPAGSYVAYAAASNLDSGCYGLECYGYNEHYVDDTNMGECHDAENHTIESKFTSNGWRIAYVEGGSAHLISGGAPDCMCTNYDGTPSNSSCSNGVVIEEKIYKHSDNMNNLVLKYCNQNYIQNGMCDISVVWAMNDVDFLKITGNTLSNCHKKFEDNSCGYNNDLIDNGGFYFYNSYAGNNLFYARSAVGVVSSITSNFLEGIRPVIKLDSTVTVVGGTGTYEDPYLITK